MAINYVRFQRGTLAAYQTLLEKGQIDSNTLYFIYAEDESSVGFLYMGEKLISGGEASYVQGTLEELSNVDASDAESNSFLVKDDATDNWVAKTPAQVAQLIQEYLEKEEIVQPEGDGLSIEVIDNVIQLKNYGTNYYAFVPAVKDENGQITEASKYILTEGFKAGLEPKVEEVDGNLIVAWYEPNSEVAENIAAQIDAIGTNVEEAKNAIAANSTAIAKVQEDVNVVAGDVEEITEIVNDLSDQIGIKSTENVAASGIYKDLESLEALLGDKANVSDVYTKDETNTAILAAVADVDHLRRKIVDSIDDINVEAIDAHLYIYMVPTGLQLADDKYDEYIVINGHIEKVGSWEVDLSDYVTKTELLINSVSNDFTINNKQLILNNLEISKINSLQDILNKKVNAEEGYTLLSSDDKAKLDKLVIGEDNNLEVSGSVNAANVKGLTEWLNEHAANTPGLSENNLTDELLAKLSSTLFISSVDTKELNVDNTGKLSIVEIEQNKVTGLIDALNAKASQETVNTLNDLVAEISASLAKCVSQAQYDEDMAEIREIMTWKEM